MACPTLVGVSDQREVPEATSQVLTIDDLARQQEAREVRNAGQLGADVWKSDEELESFLFDVRASRNASTA